MFAVFSISVSTPLDPQQEGSHHVGHKQTLGAGHNTSGPTVCDSLWVIQRERRHTVCISPLIVIQIRGDNTQSEGDSGDLSIGRLNTHTKSLHTDIHSKASNRKVQANQTNKHTPHTEGPQGIHSGSARPKTAAQWAEGAGQEKKRWHMNKSCL